MELVYLWIEDYKNIKKQGFNFSPRFKCTFKDNELTIIEDKDYVSIFPDNINITAIVGENGSGKSNLLELILDLEHWARTNTSLFFITVENRKLTYNSLNFKDKISKNMELGKNIIDRKSNSPRSSSQLGLNLNFLSLSPFLNNINSIYSNSVGFYGIYNYKSNFENYSFKYNDFLLSVIPKIPNILKHKFVTDYFKIKGIPNYIVFNINEYIQKNFYDSKDIIMNSIRKYENIYQINIDNTRLLEKLLELNQNIEKRILDINKKINELEKIPIKKRIPNIKGKSIYDKVNTANDLKENRKQDEINNLNKEVQELSTIELKFAEDTKATNTFHFSTGEIVLLYYINKFQEINNKEENLILLLDECELFLHPQWQKKFIEFLFNLFKTSEFKRQIIVATHSSFIISDLPKENIIFLQAGEQKDPFKNKQTFGANIHTLLSDGFFMNDGLMGEFAKNKIDEVIKLLNSTRKLSKVNTKTCEHIISLVGEPILKSTLESMLEKKLYNNESKLDKLKRKQQNIEDEIKEIESNSND